MLKEKGNEFKFSLNDKDGKIWNLKDIKSKFIILYFYPHDSTEGCTIEANEFNNLRKDFDKINCKIIGISGGDEKTKKTFCEENNLKITLLSDPDFAVCKKYGVYGLKKFMGKEFMGIKRTTFVLDSNKEIIETYENVKALGHAREVLDFVRNL